MDKSQKIQKILKCMKNYPEGITPKMIALDTRINVNTIKGLLPQIPQIKKKMRGFYTVVNKGDGTLVSGGDLFDWNFHNCIMRVRLLKSVKRMSRVWRFGLVSYTLVVGGSGQATFRISSTYPLNVSSLCACFAFFQSVVGSLCGVVVSSGETFISSIEFNRDHSNLRLDGVRSVSLDGLVRQFKAYQKRGGLRVEHKTSVPLCVGDVVGMLGGSAHCADVNVVLRKQGELLERMTVTTSNNTRLLLSVIDRLNGVVVK